MFEEGRVGEIVRPRQPDAVVEPFDIPEDRNAAPYRYETAQKIGENDDLFSLNEVGCVSAVVDPPRMVPRPALVLAPP